MPYILSNANATMNNSTIKLFQELRKEFVNRSTAAIVGEIFTLLVINVLALLGKLLVCMAYRRNYLLRSSTNMLVVSLAVTDFMISTAVMPLTIIALLVGKWAFRQTVCEIQGFLTHLLAFLSLQIMALTAINRYLRVFKAKLFRKVFTRRQTALIIVSVSVFTLVFFVGLLFIAKSSFIFHPGKVICVIKFRNINQSRVFTVVSSILFVVIPALVITICYLNVFKSFKQHRNNFNAKYKSRNGPARLSRIEISVTRTVFTIVAVFFTTWIPCFIIDLTDTMYSSYLPRPVYMTYTFLAFASSAVNPIIYGVMNKTFRMEFYRLTLHRGIKL